MSQYKKGKIGLRWRAEKEVISGKGQFICGNRKCDEKVGLGSYEVNFFLCRSRGTETSTCEVGSLQEKSLLIRGKKRKKKEKGLSSEEEMDLKGRDKRKREHGDESEDTTEDESVDKRSRKEKDCKGSSKRNVGNKDDDFEEFLEGMFP